MLVRQFYASTIELFSDIGRAPGAHLLGKFVKIDPGPGGHSELHLVYGKRGRTLNQDKIRMFSKTQFADTGLAAGSNASMLMMVLNEGKQERQMHLDSLTRQETENAMRALTDSLAFRNRVIAGAPISLLDGTSISTRPEGWMFPPSLPVGETTYQPPPPPVTPWETGPSLPEEAPPAYEEGSDTPPPPPPVSTFHGTTEPPPPPPRELGC